MKVKLQKIIDELQMRFIDNMIYYNKATGETLIVNDDDFRIVEDDDFEKKHRKISKVAKRTFKRMYQHNYECHWRRIELE